MTKSKKVDWCKAIAPAATEMTLNMVTTDGLFKLDGSFA